MSNIKERAMEIYQSHIALASTDGRLFRKTVLTQMMQEFNISVASSATYYNNCKKASEPIAGLGRPTSSANLRRPNRNNKTNEVLQDDEDCFSVIELLYHSDDITVGRCRSYLTQGDASEDFDDRVKYIPNTTWVLIKGLGPNAGTTYALSQGEAEIKRYSPKVVQIVEKDEPLLLD